MRQKTARTRLAALVAVVAAVTSLVVVPRYLIDSSPAGASGDTTSSSDASAYDLSGTPAGVAGWQDAMANLAYAAAAPAAGFDATTLYDLPAESPQGANVTWIDDPAQAGSCPATLTTCFANSQYGIGLRPGDSSGSAATAYIYRVNDWQSSGTPRLYPITSTAYGWDGDGHARIVFTATNWAAFAAVGARSGGVDLSPLFPLLQNQSAPPDYTFSASATSTGHPVYRMSAGFATTAPTKSWPACPETCYRLTVGPGFLIGYLSVSPDFVIFLPTDGSGPEVVRHAELAYRARGSDTGTYPPLMRFTLTNGAAIALPASGDPVGEVLAGDVYFPTAGTLSDLTSNEQLAANQTERAPWAGSVVSTAEFDFRSNLGLSTSQLTVKDDYTRSELPPGLLPVDLADPKSLLDDGAQFLYVFSSSDATKPVASRVTTAQPAPPLDRDPSVTAIATGFAPLTNATDGTATYRPVLAVQRGQRADSITLYDLGSRTADRPLVQSLSSRLTQTHTYLPPPSPPTTRNSANSSWISGTQAIAFVGTQAVTDPALFTPSTAWTVVDAARTQVTDSSGASHPVHVGGFGTYQQVDSAGNPVGDAVAVFAAQDDNGNLYLLLQSGGTPPAAVQEISANAKSLIAAGAAAHDVSQGAVNDLFALYTSANQFGGIQAGSGRSQATLSSTALGLVRTGTTLPTTNGGRHVLSPLEAQKLFAPEKQLEDALGQGMNSTTVAADLRMLLAHEAAIAASLDTAVHDDDVKVTAAGDVQAIADPVDLAMARLAAVAIVDATRMQNDATNDPATYNVVLALLKQHFPNVSWQHYTNAVRAAYSMLGIRLDDPSQYQSVTQDVLDERAALDPDVRTGSTEKPCETTPGWPLGALSIQDRAEGSSTTDCRLLGGPIDTARGLTVLSQATVSVGRLAGNRLAQLAIQQDFTDLMALGNQVPALGDLAGKVAESQKSILSLLGGVDPALASSVVSRTSNSAERDEFATEPVTNTDMAAAVSLMPYLLATVVRLGDRMLAYTALTATNLAEMLRVINTPGYLAAVQTAITGRLPRSVSPGGVAAIDFGSLFKDVASQPTFREVPILTTFNSMGGFGTISGLMVLAIIAAKYIGQPVASWQDQLSVVGAVFTFVSYASHYIKSYAALKGLFSTASTVQGQLGQIGTRWGGFRDALASINVAASNDTVRSERIAYVLLRKKKQNGFISIGDVKAALATHLYTQGDLDGAAKAVYLKTTGELSVDPRTNFADVVLALRNAALNDPTRQTTIDLRTALAILGDTKELQAQVVRVPTGWGVTNRAALSAYLQKHLPISAQTAETFASNIQAAARSAQPDVQLVDIFENAAATTRSQVSQTMSDDQSSVGDDSARSDLIALDADQAPEEALARNEFFKQQMAENADPNMSQADRDRFRASAAKAEWTTLYRSVLDEVDTSTGRATLVSFDAIAARQAAVLSHVIVLGDLGSGIISLVLAIDLMRNGDYGAGVSGIVFATLYIVASILELFGAAAFEFGGFLLAMVAAIIELILQMLPPDPSKDRGALFNWAKPYADAGLLADPSASPANVSITALQYWHEHSDNPTSPFPSCTSTDLGSCTYDAKNAPARGCLVNAGDGTSLALTYGGTMHVGGLYLRTRHSGCDASDNQVLVFPELGGDVVRIIAPGTSPTYPGDYSLASGTQGDGLQAGNFYFSTAFEPDATQPVAEWLRHDLGNGTFQLESRATAGQCLTVNALATCNAADSSQQWRVG